MAKKYNFHWFDVSNILGLGVLLLLAGFFLGLLWMAGLSFILICVLGVRAGWVFAGPGYQVLRKDSPVLFGAMINLYMFLGSMLTLSLVI